MAFQKKTLFVYGLFFIIATFFSCDVKKEITPPTSTQEIISADLALFGYVPADRNEKSFSSIYR